jgi:phospholipid/cholesterol/gamma-HCH transport system substrate-binding protein
MQQDNKPIVVGFFTLGAMLLLMYGWGWLKSFSLFHNPQRFTARFDDVAGLNNSAPVSVQGVRVGTVEALNFTPQRKIDCHIKITNETLQVPRGADISIQTVGLVGAKYLEITLPKDVNGNVVKAEPLTENDVLAPPGQGNAALGVVHNPVRVEVIVNNVAKHVDEIVSNIDTESAKHAINNLSAATSKLNKNMDKLSDAADSVQVASRDISTTSLKFGKTADNAAVASERASTFFRDGDATFKDVGALARDFRHTSGRLNKMLDDPNFSGDVKETITQAKQTAETIRGAIGDVNTTLKDKELRGEVTSILNKLQQSTENIRKSMDVVDKVSGDQGLRSDLKEVVKGAREAVTQANTLLNEPGMKTDIRTTMKKVQNASDNIDVASKQVQQVLSKRAPLLHLMFGRPGKITPQTCDPTPPCPPTQNLTKPPTQ